MPDENKPMEDADIPAIKIIKQIENQEIDPKTLPKIMRQAVVECLLSQFWSISKIAAFVKKGERTIERDQVEIEERNSRKPSIDYSLQLISQLMRKATATQEQLMTLSKSKDGSVQEKTQAAFYLWKAIQEQMKLLQSLGYLPEQPFKIEATIAQEGSTDITKLKEELAQAETVASEIGKAEDPAILGLIKSIKQDIAIAEANSSMDELKKLLDKSNKSTDNPNESSGQ